MGGIKTEIGGRQSESMTPEIINRRKEVFAVMAACIGELQGQGKIYFKGFVAIVEHIQGVTEVLAVVVVVAVSALAGVRIGIIA